MAVKTTAYSALKLDWLKTSIEKMQDQVDEILNNPVDRRGQKEVASGRLVENAIIIRAEDRLKIGMDLMEKIQKMLPAVEAMEKLEEEKKQVRGNQQLSPFEEGVV